MFIRVSGSAQRRLLDLAVSKIRQIAMSAAVRWLRAHRVNLQENTNYNCVALWNIYRIATGNQPDFGITRAEATKRLHESLVEFPYGKVRKSSIPLLNRALADNGYVASISTTKPSIAGAGGTVKSATTEKSKPKNSLHPKKNWKSKTNPNSPEFLTSAAWRRVRYDALRLYGRRCQCCGATPESGAIMNVDHILPRKTHPHLSLEIKNLQVLCSMCNHGKGNRDQTDWRI